MRNGVMGVSAVLAATLCGAAASGQVVAEQAEPKQAFGLSVVDAGLLLADEVVDTIPFDSLDIASLRTLEIERRERNEAPHFAVGRDVALSPVNAGSVFALENGRKAWRLRIECDNARNISVGTVFDLPDSATIYVTDANGVSPYRGLTSVEEQPSGELWMPMIQGSVMDLYAEVDADEWAAFEAGFMVFQVNLGFLGLGESILADRSDAVRGFSDACQIDVECSEGDPWDPQIRSVAMYVVSGVSGCSGSMINNTAQDGRPLFYTANHCSATNFASSMTVYFNYQNSFCRTGSQSGQNGNGSLSNVLFGATRLMTYATADTTLVELNATPPESWNVTWAGWNRSSSSASDAFGVHHPNLAEKRISIEPDGSQIDGAFHRVQYNNGMGGIEGGSSGSPLFDQNGRIIGTACCVNTLSPCFPQFTFYGRVSSAWNGGGSSTSRLRDHLDPIGAGVTTLDWGEPPFAPPPPPEDPPGAFGLTSPADGATGIDASAALVFTWGAAADADQYTVMVASDPGMTNIVVGPIVRTTENLLVFGGTFQQGETYYWSVEAANSNPSPTSSTPSVASFSTGAPAQTGSCCFGCFDLGNGSEWVACTDDVLEADCEAAEGKWSGVGSTCAALPCDSYCAGDLLGDGNGNTTLDDFTVLASSFGLSSGATRADGDLNCDTGVTLADFTDLAADFGCTGSSGHSND